MKKFPVVLSILLILGFLSVSSFAQNKYKLTYKFRKGDVLKYRTERHDSTASEFSGQSMERKMASWSLRSVNVKDIDEQGLYIILMRTDSTWTDNAEIEKQFKKMNGKREVKYTFDQSGHSNSDNPPLSLLFLNLPKKPVAVNDEWNYELHSVKRGRRSGKTNLKAKCTLYSIDKENGDDIAVIIVNTETKSTGKFSFKRQNMKTSGTFASSGTGTSIVYFNITKGYVREVVTEDNSESSTESSAFSSSASSKTRSTTKLISK
ncbi:hypothetical protein J7K93_11255 [bacterium]|nr:hypothetical protein [bacterium]